MIIQTAGWIEVVGGGLLALGLFSRITAFVTSGEMAFAYFIGHAPISVWPAHNHGDAAILMCFVFFLLRQQDQARGASTISDGHGPTIFILGMDDIDLVTLIL